MLEARDRMSRPLQQAARASQGLQSRVESLSRTLNSSRNSVQNAAVANRILAERYRELGQRIGVADEQVKLSVKLFRMLPAPIRLAAYTIEGYVKALRNAVTQNAIVKVSTNLLTLSFKALSAAAYNLGYYATNAIKKLGEITRLNKVFESLKRQLDLVKIGVKMFSQNLLNAAKTSKLFMGLNLTFRNIKNSLQAAYLSAKLFDVSLLGMAKNTKLFMGLNLAIQNTKRHLQAGALAFNLWKNASPTIDKISRSFDKLTSKFPKFDKLKENFRNINQQLGQLEGRRATFNQLADSNARLNRQVEKLNRELSKSNSTLSSMKSNMSSLNAIGLTFSGVYAAQGAANAGSRVAQSTVGTAMEQNYSQASVGILAGAENGAKFYKQISDYAASTTYSAEDWSRNMRSAIMKSSSIEDLQKYQVVMEQLATLDPVQGLDGAALAVRELNSGDITSLVERFELPRSALKDIKAIEDPIKQIEALSKMIGDNTGYSAENIQKMKELPLMQWQKMTNAAKTMMGYIGQGALEKIAPIMQKINDAWDAGKFQPFIDTMSAGLANLTQKAIDFVNNFGANVGAIKERWQPAIDLFNNIKASWEQAWPTISGILTNAQVIFNLVASDINANWPAINGIFQTALDLVKQFSDWVVNNWPAITAVVAGVVAALATLKIVNTVAAGITVLRTAITLWRNGTLLMTAAQWLLNTALLANPIGLIIALVVGLGVALIVAYNKSETFRNAVQACLNWLKGAGVAALNAGRDAINWVKDAASAAAEWFGTLWDKISGAIGALKNFSVPAALKKAAELVGIVGSSGGDGNKHHGGLNRVPYDGYKATLHKGERILTRSEAQAADKGGIGGGVSVTGNTFIVRQDSDIDAIANALYTKLASAKTAMG